MYRPTSQLELQLDRKKYHVLLRKLGAASSLKMASVFVEEISRTSTGRVVYVTAVPTAEHESQNYIATGVDIHIWVGWQSVHYE